MGDPYIDYGQPTGMGMTAADKGYTAPAANTAFPDFPKSSGVDWRGVGEGSTYAPDYGAVDKVGDTIKTTTNALSATAGIAAGAGIMTSGTGFIVAGLIRLAGGILGALARPKPHRNPEEVAFERMVKFYRNLGKKSDVARSMASLFTGKSKASFSGIIGYDNPMDAYKKNPTAWKNTTGE